VFVHPLDRIFELVHRSVDVLDGFDNATAIDLKLVTARAAATEGFCFEMGNRQRSLLLAAWARYVDRVVRESLYQGDLPQLNASTEPTLRGQPTSTCRRLATMLTERLSIGRR